MASMAQVTATAHPSHSDGGVGSGRLTAGRPDTDATAAVVNDSHMCLPVRSHHS